MPNKKINNLKDGFEKQNAQYWQKHFGVKDMTTRELFSIEANNEFDKDPKEVRRRILSERKK